MKSFVLAITAVGLIAPMTATPSFAGVGSSLGECYNILISWCNDNSNHPQACANHVMDECDELHGAKLVGGLDLPLAGFNTTGGNKHRKPASDPKPEPRPVPKPGKDAAVGTDFRN
ncbi:MAG: hypothetical protein ABI832_03305 [bacterium]